MKLKTTIAALCLSLLCLSANAAAVTYPGPPATDTSGVAVTSGVTDAIVSVVNLDGTAISSPGAVAHIAAGNPSVVYDAAAKGEAWITYSLTASGHTFNNVTLFCSSDPQTLASANTSAATAATDSAANGTTLASGVKVSVGTGSGQINLSSGTVPLSSADETHLANADTQSATAATNATPANFWGYGARTLTAQSDSAGVTTLLTRIPSAITLSSGAVTIGTNNDKSGYSLATAPLTSSQVASAVLDATASSHNTAGTIGYDINTSGSANDPWSTALPGSYTSGQAGYIIGHNIDAMISSRLATSGYTAPNNPATVSLSSADETRLGYLTGNLYGLLNPMISAGAFTIAALANSPAGSTPPTAVQIRQEIDANSTKLASLSSGQSSLATAIAALPSASAISNAVLGASIDGSITLKQAEALALSVNSGHYAIGALNTTSHTKTYTYYRQDGTTVLATSVVTYDSGNTNPLSRTVTFSNLP